MQTILGAGGNIGVALARLLPGYTDRVRLVSRHPKATNDLDEVLAADLRNKSEVLAAVAGSDVVYLTVGLKYSAGVWKRYWPVIMENVLDACEFHRARLVFFDNVYMYDCEALSHMTEQTPIKPCSAKGQVRAQLVRMLTERVEQGRVEALVARSADFYGPGNTNSVLLETVYHNLKAAKTANWLASDQYVHSFTYTPDAAEATALLGNTPEVYNQVWHLPTSSERLNGREWVELIAQALGVKPSYRIVSHLMVRMIGLFVPIMAETREMMYQYDRDYFFDSSKFEDHFDYTPTDYATGIATIIEQDQ